MLKNPWQIYSCDNIPENFFEKVSSMNNNKRSNYLTKLLWARNFRKLEDLQDLFSHNQLLTSYTEFGSEIKQGLITLENSWNNEKKIAIWGGFNIDGVVATSILWEGLQPFFTQENQLIYYISSSFTKNNSLNFEGIDFLYKKGINLIISVDIGSNNLREINFANTLGIDMIIIDHHILPPQRPPVISFLNSLNFSEHHPFYNLCSVMIAYKLLEAIYDQFPSISKPELSTFLDLITIGLLADNTPLKGNSRYLAKQGINILKHTTRQGIETLIKFCKVNGDRPMDISQGIIPRIKTFNYVDYNNNLINLLITKDKTKSDVLAKKVENNYFNSKDLQKKYLNIALKKIQNLDLSNIGIIILYDKQWEGRFLELISEIISEKYGHPTILLYFDEMTNLAKGYGFSPNKINLYEFVKNQESLLNNFNYYHQRIELSLPIENIDLFSDSINQNFRSKINLESLQKIINIDLVITVAELGENLCHELRLIEPCYLDNPIPKLLIKNCYFSQITKDKKKQKNQYIKTYFLIHDDSSNKGFNGIWFGHYSNEINANCLYDVVLELDYNFGKNYYVRIIDLKLIANQKENHHGYTKDKSLTSIMDYRLNYFSLKINDFEHILLDKCPLQWQEITNKYRIAMTNRKDLVLAYNHNEEIEIEKLWQKFIKVIDNSLNENKPLLIDDLLEELTISTLSLKSILDSLINIEITYEVMEEKIIFNQIKSEFNSENYCIIKECFKDLIKQENLQKSYFYQVPLSIIEEEIVN